MRGVSLLEVVVALVLLALAVWALQILYLGLLSGTRLADNTQEVTAALKTVLDATRSRIRTEWPASAPPDPTSVSSGQMDEYTYEVTDNGRQRDPADATGNTYFELKVVDVELFYYQPDTGEKRSQKVTMTVVR